MVVPLGETLLTPDVLNDPLLDAYSEGPDGKGAEVPKGYTIDSLDMGLKVMLMFLDEPDALTVTQVALKLGASRSTAHRILSTLQARGLVALSSSGRGYYAGPVFVEIARPYGPGVETRRWVRSILQRAVHQTGETVHAAVLLGSQILMFDGLASDRESVGATMRVGRLCPAYATSGGKLLLSRLNVEQVKALYPQEELPQMTPWTIKSRSRLLDQLQALSMSDFAINKQETEVGVTGAAVILGGRSWRDRIALLASVPTTRGDEQWLSTVATRLLDTVASSGQRPAD